VDLGGNVPTPARARDKFCSRQGDAFESSRLCFGLGAFPRDYVKLYYKL